jgi:hypothetical protein
MTVSFRRLRILLWPMVGGLILAGGLLSYLPDRKQPTTAGSSASGPSMLTGATNGLSLAAGDSFERRTIETPEGAVTLAYDRVGKRVVVESTDLATDVSIATTQLDASTISVVLSRDGEQYNITAAAGGTDLVIGQSSGDAPPTTAAGTAGTAGPNRPTARVTPSGAGAPPKKSSPPSSGGQTPPGPAKSTPPAPPAGDDARGNVPPASTPRGNDRAPDAPVAPVAPVAGSNPPAPGVVPGKPEPSATTPTDSGVPVTTVATTSPTIKPSTSAPPTSAPDDRPSTTKPDRPPTTKPDRPPTTERDRPPTTERGNPSDTAPGQTKKTTSTSSTTSTTEYRRGED